MYVINIFTIIYSFAHSRPQGFLSFFFFFYSEELRQFSSATLFPLTYINALGGHLLCVTGLFDSFNETKA